MEIFKVIIAGSRSYADYRTLMFFCDNALYKKAETHRIEIVSGTCRGADKLGERYATERGLPIKRFPADWGSNGKAAGPIRNQQMADYADALIAFWGGDKSGGTWDMLLKAYKSQLLIRIKLI